MAHFGTEVVPVQTLSIEGQNASTESAILDISLPYGRG
jgi:hypothetical protein